jgi:hypothetical protein
VTSSDVGRAIVASATTSAISLVVAALVQRLLLKRHGKMLGGTAPGGGSEGQKDLCTTCQAIEGAMLLWEDVEGGQAALINWLAESTCSGTGTTALLTSPAARTARRG